MKVYFDNAATTQQYPEVIDEMTSVLKNNFGNPSSIHSYGRESKVLIEDARSRIANYLNVLPSEIFFTSGGTEAIVTALIGCIQEKEISHIITSPIEHHVVLHTIKALEQAGLVKVTMLNIDDKGNVDLEDLHEVLKANVKSLVVLMHANNEIGTMLPMKEVGDLCSDYNAFFLSDTVQTMGKYKNDLQNINLHFATCSGHKLHGPKGVGFLYINDDVRISPLFKGGGQERNMRSGTENIAGIVGLAKTFDIAYSNMEQTEKYIEGLKTYMASELEENFSEIKFNACSHQQGLFTVLNVSFPRNEKTEMLLFNLDIAGIATSGGSACNAGVVSVSHVLKEIRCDESRVPIRFSFGKFNTKEEVDYCVGELKRLL